jgi:hypothetical protein
MSNRKQKPAKPSKRSGKPSKVEYAAAAKEAKRFVKTKAFREFEAAQVSIASAPHPGLLPPSPEWGEPGYIEWYNIYHELTWWVYHYEMAAYHEGTTFYWIGEFNTATGGVIV